MCETNCEEATDLAWVPLNWWGRGNGIRSSSRVEMSTGLSTWGRRLEVNEVDGTAPSDGG